VRSFVLGLLLLLVISFSVLSLRPGGLRRQLRMAARRLRIALVLAGIYVVGAAVLRLAFTQGPVIDFGLPLLAIALASVFLVIGRDPVTEVRP
jgi:hypothetical protein